MAAKNSIVLATLNSRYMHTAFGLRYLYANLGELQSTACIEEFTIQQRAIDIAEKLLKHQPEIIGFGVYIWKALTFWSRQYLAGSWRFKRQAKLSHCKFGLALTTRC